MPKVAVVPWLAHGHMIPLAQLCLKLAAESVAVTVVCTPLNIPRMRAFLGDDPRSESIEFAEIGLPQVEGLPAGVESTGDAEHPEHKILLMEAVVQMKDPLTQLLRRIKPDCVVCEMWIPLVAAEVGAPTVFFVVYSIAANAFFVYRRRPPTLPLPASFDMFRGAFRREDAHSEQMRNCMSTVVSAFAGCSAIIVNTCEQMEGEFLEYSSKAESKLVLGLGPLLPVEPAGSDLNTSEVEEWVKKQKAVVYVAFGSECVVREDDLREVALGLEQSGVVFLWALRRGREALPAGFERRIVARGCGVVVQEWVPQRRILAHRNVVAFVSHCGWNSVMEGAMMGVPVVAVPMQYEQGLNARVATAYLQLGVEVPRDSRGKLHRHDLCAAVTRVAVDSGDAETARIRQRVEEMSHVLQREIMCAGGSQDVHIRKFVELIPSLTIPM